jgi:iron complex outermembrane receptor protein
MTAQADSTGIADIIVTATRQATNMQDTPIAITAVTAQALEEQGLKTVADLGAVVPNAQFKRAQGAFGPGVTTFIRGIGTTDTSLGGEAAVAFYIDDVYYPILLGSNFDLLDIDHIEVLRGPQGTLFGRNSLAGAINIVSRRPSFSESSGYVEATIGEYNRRDLRAGFNLPIGENAALMISGLSRQSVGYMRMLDFKCEMNRRGSPELAGQFPYHDQQLSSTPNFSPENCTIGHLGGENVQAVRGSVRWEPASDVELTLSADHTWDDSENPADYTVDLNPSNVNANISIQSSYWGLQYDQRFITGDPFTTYATYTDRIQAGQVVPGSTFYTGLTSRGGLIMSPITHLKNWGLTAKLVWGVTSNIDVTLVAGHRAMDENHSFDNDASPLVIEHVMSEIGNKYDNVELRVSGRSDFADWVIGAFYFDAFGYFHATNYSPTTAGVKTLYTTFEPNSKAVFGNVTLRPFGDRLGIVLGARYSKDHKFVNYSNLTDVGPHPNAGDTIFQVDPTQKKLSWKAGLNYQVSQDALVYISAATGNSLPGYNARPLQPSQVTQFDGNDNVAYEIGAKLDLFDRRARFNLAAFYTDFNNRPASIGGAEPLLDVNTGREAVGNQTLEPLPGGPPGSTRCSATNVAPGTGIVCLGRTYYTNQPATIRGAEVEFILNPLDALTINGSVGYSKFKAPDIAARLVNRRQNYPYWTSSAGIQYEIESDLADGSITPRMDWVYQSSEVVSGTSTKYNDINGPRSVFNVRVTYKNDSHDFSLAAGITNVFNKFYYVNFFDYQGLGRANTQAQPGRPRQWYLTLSKDF